MINKIGVTDFVIRLPVEVNQITGCGTRETNVSLLGFTRPIDDTTNDCNIHGRSNVIKAPFELVHCTYNIEVLP